MHPSSRTLAVSDSPDPGGVRCRRVGRLPVLLSAFLALGILAGPVLPTHATPTGAAGSDPEAELHAWFGVASLDFVDWEPVSPIEAQGEWSRDVVIADVLERVSVRPHSLRSEDFRLFVTDAAGRRIARTPAAPRTFRGTIEGIDDSAVALSRDPDGRVRGLLTSEATGDWVIEPVPEPWLGLVPGDHVAYRAIDVEAPDGTCGVPDTAPEFDFEGGERPQPSRGGAALRVCEIACDADREFFVANGSDVDATVADIEQILNATEVIYERDVEIVYDLTTILVRTSEPDPYSSTDPGNLLSQFRSHWRNQQGDVRRDVAHLFTGKNLDGSVIGVAWVGTICQSFGYGLSQSRYTGNFLLRTSLTAHELGHNWDSSHCSGSDCRIMCPSNGGCTGDVTRFGLSSRDQITAHRDSRGCLGTIVLPDPVDPPFLDTFASSTIDGSLWTEVEGAEVDGGAENERSGSLALRLDAASGDPDSIASNRIQTGEAPRLWISYWVQGRNLEGSERLLVELYDRNLSWQRLGTVTALGTPGSHFDFRSHFVQGESHDRLRLRLRPDVDDGDDAFYVEDVQVVVSETRVDLSPRLSGLAPGETYRFDASVANLTASPSVVEAWIDVTREDGSPLYPSNPKFGPKTLSLAPGETKGRENLPMRVPASTPEGRYRVVAYVGSFPDRIDWSDQAYFQVAIP